MERRRTWARLYRQNETVTPEERERRRQYAREYNQKKRDQRDKLNSNSIVSSSTEDGEELKIYKIHGCLYYLYF